ncbi:hypothetical protein KIN20_023455 [Parelaphostrongylus tenuis]|uniref:Uncharacterized protein n=1 Tax=Parelaphostrongylus tenuis TaxID=148309 RepID=A0AAD5MS13_PARTN|nr:hypothetical protein KIN20_023455 [Parelaphostrongylus tenuis]
MLLICLFWIVVPVLGCGTLPGGQARNVSFTVGGFTLPVQMTWTTDRNVASRVPGILRSGADVRAFVQRLIMQSVFDVLERQGRSAGLGEPVYSGNFEPTNCSD